ncbi:hypothetical protein GCM10022403_083370 [Streptomyces coacervatus]|uniref:Secreted protein/lipoprotein n=1 Tax=Streptomyces coacervatus TaxID=647381 RepID=A0ABP7J9A7_9ACTN|nr:hypothetical protein [Streptomyces coacervatus]MDF2270306.1 hypothetical protein [Streptomyces coacervatus]
MYAGVGAGLTLVVAGCTDSGHGTPGAGSAVDRRDSGVTSPSTSHTWSRAEAAQEQATQAYRGMWQDMATEAETSNWQSPLLARHATGEALGAITRGMYADHLNGLITKGEPKNSPSVTQISPSADPAVVLISDCGDSTHWLKYRKRTGQLADDAPGGRQQITAEVKKQDDGTWKVARFAVEGVGSC